MPGKANLDARKITPMGEIIAAMKRYDKTAGLDYMLRRWVAQMTAVEIHGIWERYVESRLVAALNHDPKHFIKEQNIAGVSGISIGLAQYVVRGGKPFLDFRSMDDLIGKADHWLGKTGNPFRSIDATHRGYIDCLAAIRNHVVHGSDSSFRAYKRKLKLVYGIDIVPRPSEFLHAKDYRPTKPDWLSRGNPKPFVYRSRLSGLATVLIRVISYW